MMKIMIMYLTAPEFTMISGAVMIQSVILDERSFGLIRTIFPPTTPPSPDFSD